MKVISQQTAAKLLNVSRPAISYFVTAKKIHGIRDDSNGRLIGVRLRDVQRMLASRVQESK